jgi:hypothetical protein
MKYSDLAQFDPIRSVVELERAEDTDRAKRHVSTYVISDEMADRLTGIVFPQLRFDQPADNHGLFVVGNYGTGKSHLMSVIASVAEHEHVASQLRHEGVQEEAASVAGRFQVCRAEIGSTTMSLRDILVSTLEEFLSGKDVAYSFPDPDTIKGHKSAFADMMAAFYEAFPDQGLLLVVDELLDYLAGRDDKQVINDLNFLREVGEACNSLRFRFIAGVQESLFESPDFQFTADRLRRVKDRFEQIRIAQSDVKFVVQERLLQKSADQQVRIREHLEPLAPFFGDMSERMDEFVRLFPVHPDYIDTFERLTVIEKREVLKTLSAAMQERLGEEVPPEQPGLIAYDSYWKTIRENPSFRSKPDIKEVVECAEVLEARVKQSLSAAYRPMALRIIYGLAVHRLSVSDIYAATGLTAKDLRDQLALYEPHLAEMGGAEPAEDLATHVETVLGKIVEAVNGQFISQSDTSQQYFLDLKKTQDFDAILAQKAQKLSDDQLDRYYYAALRRAMECRDETDVTGYAIWEHGVPWRERNVERRGWLFFGAPNERSTAAPPHDFNLYFPQPFNAPDFDDEERSDEVYFPLTGPDEEFLEALRTYAAAIELSQRSSGNAQDVYERKAREQTSVLAQWLQGNLRTAYTVTHEGTSKPLGAWLEGTSVRQQMDLGPDQTGAMRDVVNAVASLCLAAHFEEQAPEYPTFANYITEANREKAARDALRWIGGRQETKAGAAALDALELLDGERLSPRDSRYARHVLERMKSKGEGQVLNRSELLDEQPDGYAMAEDTYRLETAWVVVVLAALVHHGEAVLELPGRTFDATDLDTLAATPVEDLKGFKHVKPPKEWPVAALGALFELLDLPRGHARALAQGDDTPIGELQHVLSEVVRRLVTARQAVADRMQLWGRPVLADDEAEQRRARLDEAKQFLESLQSYNTTGKLKNFRPSVEEVEAHEKGLRALGEVEALCALVSDLTPLTSYLSHAQTVLPDGHAWTARVQEARGDFQQALHDPERRTDAAFRADMERKLAALRDDYVQEYMKLHARARLSRSEDERKADVLRDRRLNQLSRLSEIDVMHTGQLRAFKDALAELETCSHLTEKELHTAPRCPHCKFSPSEERTVSSGQQLDRLETQLDTMTAEWTRTLADELRASEEQIDLLDAEAQPPIRQFLDEEELPEPVSDSFVSAANSLLEGLTSVPVSRSETYEALKTGGSSATPGELRRRFEAFLDEKTDGQDDDSIRLLLEE